MTLRLKTVQQFMHQMNPCDFRPAYKEDCDRCMDKFCKVNNTTREEYFRKKVHLKALQTRISELESEIMDHLRKDPKYSLTYWLATQMNALQKEIEET